MANKTTYFELIKPTDAEYGDVADLNQNMDVIDDELHKRGKTVNGVEPDESGDYKVDEVQFAHQIVADDAQQSSGEYIFRTTGGDASLSDGEAKLVSLFGRSLHTGATPESLNMSVNAVPREEGEESIVASINMDTFVAYVLSSGTITLSYTDAWSANPSLYGVTVEGTPVAGDSIVIVYVKEERGLITNSDPDKFISTGWNLYNHTVGYAKVKKYSSNYGFLCGGTYTKLEFAATLEGEKTTITPASGYFTIPSDGYIFVTGGNNTNTYILMTWSDWGSGYEGSFKAYEESVIDFSTIMTNFPYGLLQVGGHADEINLGMGKAISRIERLAYTAENLAAAKASGREWEADTNYIYIVREVAIEYATTVSGNFTACDHGEEIIDGTTVPVYVQTLYGQNLVDKLRTDVVTKSNDFFGANMPMSKTDNTKVKAVIESIQTMIANVINPGGLAANERYLPGDLGTITLANIADFVTSYGLSTGAFKDIYPGCYVKIGDSVANTTWMVGGLDVLHNTGDTAMGHGAEFIPRGAGFAYGTKMNGTNTTAGGYKGSAMWTYLANTLVPALQAVLGTHLLKQRVLVSNAVDTSKASQYSGFTGMASGWEWADAYAVLMSEIEVYGSMVWGGPYDIGEAKEKLPVFNFISPVEFERGSFWLRSVASGANFAFCYRDGGATSNNASLAGLCVRPRIRIG